MNKYVSARGCLGRISAILFFPRNLSTYDVSKIVDNNNNNLFQFIAITNYITTKIRVNNKKLHCSTLGAHGPHRQLSFFFVSIHLNNFLTSFHPLGFFSFYFPAIRTIFLLLTFLHVVFDFFFLF